MIPPTHFLASWVVANTVPLSPRQRAIVTIAGVIPDFDGFGYPLERLTEGSSQPLQWYSAYHHILGHNVAFAAVVVVASGYLSKWDWKTVLLACVTFHLHLLCDVAGSRGADNYQWPIPYLLPFSDRWQWTWSGQWELSSWPNRLIGVGLLIITLWLARERGYSPFEMVSKRADEALVGLLRRIGPARHGE